MSRLYKFHNFLLESKISELLLEGNLMASDKFLSRLNGLNNNIAQILFKSFKDKQYIDKDLSQNWIDITDKEDTVSFISDRNASRTTSDEIYSSRSRNEVKIGRLARAILGDLKINFTDKEIEDFVNLYKSSKVDNSKKFKLVSGLDIKKYYHEDNYGEHSGSLGGSCMRHQECQTYFKIYTRNPEQCQLLVYFDENDKVLGRALVWKISESELYTKDLNKFDKNVEYFMDRVYVARDSDVNKFIQYAKDNGWLYKYRMTADERLGMIFKYNDEIVYGKIIIKLNRLHFNRYPYVDTLSFTNGDNKISNVGFYISEDDDDPDEGFMMVDTGGGNDKCSNCDGTGRENSEGNDCFKCHGDGEVECPECKGGGETICGQCSGRGDIQCSTCHGDGEIECNICQGDRYINCRDCNGDGHKECRTCRGNGNLGDCPECKGDGDIECPECKGEEVTCKTCKGEGEYVRKWGRGTRRVTCKDCSGSGKGSSGEIGKEGCKCSTCSYIKYGWHGRTWENRGIIPCKKCEGDGSIPCKDCDSQGEIRCSTCDGRGNKRCTDCSFGSKECESCEGRGITGKCKTCKGEGTLGKCKTCKDGEGQIKCETCNGSGKRPKGQKAAKCPECSGLLDELINDIKLNRFKVN
jgi:hypothetical protein